MGFACDNYATLKIDSKVIIQQVVTADVTNFDYWRIYKISLAKGTHYIEILGNNAGGIAALGFEIYNNTVSQIINATSYQDLNIVFSTKDQIGKPVQDGDSTITYSCPIGYTLNYCSSNIPVCSQIAPVRLTITNPPPACVASGVDITNSPVTAGSSTGLTYSYWADSLGTVPIPNPKKIVQNGTYYIIATTNTGSGCSVVKPVLVTVKPNAASTIISAICYGGSFLGYNKTGTYIDTLVASDGCDSIRTLNLQVAPPIRSSIGVSICPGSSYLGYNSTGIYIDTLITSGGCDSIRTLNLTVNPIRYSTITAAACKGESYLGYNKSGTYIDTLNASDGCDSIRTVNLTVNDNPKPDLGTNDIVCINDSLILNPGIFNQYLWQDGSTTPTYKVTLGGTYWVRVTDENGCVASDTITVKREYCSLLKIPNTFTPNGDGINDTWDIYALQFFPGCTVSVYTRWGKLVFFSNGYPKPWDGTYNNAKLPVGTYYYVIDLKNNAPQVSGYVTIIR